ncbi:MAG TPA: amidohydrolase family protein [Stellaceae bacterium]|nr:amidohydrolase family protein [Stellaceae bacterium]
MTGVTPTIPPPLDTPSAPRLTLPGLSCDSHVHIFGPHARFPYAPTRTFTPHDVPASRLRALHDGLGIVRAVLVQSACHGTDHAAVLDALADAPDRYRAVALLAPDTAAADIRRLDDAGFRGVRLHFLPHLGRAPDPDAVRAMVRLIRPFGWHIALHVTGRDLVEHHGLIATLEAPVIIDHMGRVDAAEGADGAGFTQLRRLIGAGHVWVKLSGADRVTQRDYPYEDAVALARILAKDAPERVLWGSDFPHPNIRGAMPDDGKLVDLIAEIAPDETARRRMLVDNPATVFGFPPLVSPEVAGHPDQRRR